MRLRPIEPQDLSEIIEVRSSTRENAFSRTALRELGITEKSTAELLCTTHRGWLCEESGKIVGFAIGDGKTGELWVIAVLPDFEAKGVGSRLLETTEAWLWSLGWTELWLWTSSDLKKRGMRILFEAWLVCIRDEGRHSLHEEETSRPAPRANGPERPWLILNGSWTTHKNGHRDRSISHRLRSVLLLAVLGLGVGHRPGRSAAPQALEQYRARSLIRVVLDFSGYLVGAIFRGAKKKGCSVGDATEKEPSSQRWRR
jgi:GNAT superfamily N-acetyltransferase